MTWGPDWPLWAWLVVNAAATYRLTRLATKDVITDGPRRWLAGRFEGPLVTLALCPWCISMWLAAAVAALTVLVPLAWSYAAAGLTFATAAGWLSDREA